MSDQVQRYHSHCPCCGKLLKPSDIGFKFVVFRKVVNRPYQCRFCQAWLSADWAWGKGRMQVLYGCIFGPVMLIHMQFSSMLFKHVNPVYVIALPVLFVPLIFAVGYWIMGQMLFRRMYRFKLWAPQCHQCHYDMRELPHGSKCPECGGDAEIHPDSR